MEKTMKNKKMCRNNEKGNVLFLILIAVALFAALSYAVTQSTRSGGGSADRERSILSGASLTQGPATLRTSMIRMVLSGTNVDSIAFDTPAEIATLALTDNSPFVFHPEGGGGVYQTVPADVMAGGTPGVWSYNANFNVAEIGTTFADTGNDFVAFISGVSEGVCAQINDEFVISTTGCTVAANSPANVPNIEDGGNASDTTDRIAENVRQTTGGVGIPNAINALQGAGGSGCTAFSGQASGCFFNPDNSEYVFYSTLLER